MSFILDSLRRAEAERRQGETPPFDPLYEERPPATDSRRSWRAGWAVIVVINFAVVAFLAVVLLQRRPAPEADTPPTEPEARQTMVFEPTATSSQVAVSGAEAPTLAQNLRTTPQREAQPAPAHTLQTTSAPRLEYEPDEGVRFGPPVSAQADEIRTAPLVSAAEHPEDAADRERRSPSGLPASPSQVRTMAHSVPPMVPPSPGFGTQTPTPERNSSANLPDDAVEDPAMSHPPQPHEAQPQPPSPSTEPAAEALSDTRPAQRDQAFQSAPKAGGKRPSAVPEDAIPSLHDMPPDVREKLRRVKINVLVYADREEECMVYINSRRYRAGDRIGEEGYVLERILPDGIVLDYGNGNVKIRSGF